MTTPAPTPPPIPYPNPVEPAPAPPQPGPGYPPYRPNMDISDRWYLREAYVFD